MKKNNRAARAARFLVQSFEVVCQTKTWNFHIWGSDDNVSSQQEIFHSLPLHENHSYQGSESALRLFWTTWSTWNNRKRLNLAQSSILIWRFPCSCCRSFLNSQLIHWWAASVAKVKRQERGKIANSFYQAFWRFRFDLNFIDRENSRDKHGNRTSYEIAHCSIISTLKAELNNRPFSLVDFVFPIQNKWR